MGREIIEKYLKLIEEDNRNVKKIESKILIENPEICNKSMEKGADILGFIPDEVVRANPDLYLLGVKINGARLRFVPKEIQIANPEICIVAIKQSKKAYKYVCEEVKKSHSEIYIEAVKQDPWIVSLGDIPEEIFIDNQELFIKAIQKNAPNLLEYIPNEVKISHPEICLEAAKMNPSTLFQFIPNEVKTSHPEMCIDAVRRCSYILEDVPEKVKKSHPEIYIEAVKHNPYILKDVPEKVKESHPEIYIEAVKHGSYMLENVPEEVMMSHPEMCIDAVKENSNMLQYVPEELKKEHPEMCIDAVRENSNMLQYAPEEVKKERPEMCIDVVRENSNMLQYVPEEVKKEHPEMCIAAIREKPNMLQYVPEEVMMSHPEMCIDAVKEISYLLQYVPEKVKENCHEITEQVLKYYLEKYEYELYYGNYEYDEEYARLAVEHIIEGVLIDRLYYNNSDIFRQLMKHKFVSSKNISEDVKKEHPEIYVEAVTNSAEELEYVPEELREEVAIAAFQNGNVEVLTKLDLYLQRKLLGSDSPIGPEWQAKCLSEIVDKSNVILSSPTGSGKTRVFLEWAKQKDTKPVYITAPIKALSNQRYRELMEQGYTVGLETGDIKNVPENCDFICCTQEIYTNKYAEQEEATLIMDEFHYIFENPDRARTYIDALHGSKAKNILLCSATLGDIEKLGKYIDKVSGRNFTRYKSSSRLTSLSYGGRINKEDIANALVVTFSKNNIEDVLESLEDEREQCDDELYARIKEIAQKYKMDSDQDKYIIESATRGLAGYYGALLPKQKLFIEECFEQKLIDTVVGTDALAMGVNFPVKNVVFAQLAKYYDGPISKNLFDQIAGRAGRKGYFDEGRVLYCDDFETRRGYPLEARYYDTKDLYLNYITAKNEDLSITLTPNIKDILLRKRTIQEEAEYIANYSTGDVNVTQCNADIAEIVRRIEEGFDTAFSNINSDMVDDDSRVAELRGEFERNIARVYFDEYSPEMNCEIFVRILNGEDVKSLQEHYGNNFPDLLQLRKYLKALPRTYRKNINMSELEDQINQIDETALNMARGTVTVEDIKEGTKSEQKDGEALKKVLRGMDNKLPQMEQEEDQL